MMFLQWPGGQPGVDDGAGGGFAGEDVFADGAVAVACLFDAPGHVAAVGAFVAEVVFVGHVLRVGGGGLFEQGVPFQRRGSGVVGFAAGSAEGAGLVD